MGRSRNPRNPAGARGGAAATGRQGREKGHKGGRGRAGGRSCGETRGPPRDRLPPDVGTIVRAGQVMLPRGSLRAADEQTGHTDETLAGWIKRVGDHAAALTALLARARRLAAVDRAERWLFVGHKGGSGRRVSQVTMQIRRLRRPRGLSEDRPRGTRWVPRRRGLGQRPARRLGLRRWSRRRAREQPGKSAFPTCPLGGSRTRSRFGRSSGSASPRASGPAGTACGRPRGSG
jgi:hypothetical protein